MWHNHHSLNITSPNLPSGRQALYRTNMEHSSPSIKGKHWINTWLMPMGDSRPSSYRKRSHKFLCRPPLRILGHDRHRSTRTQGSSRWRRKVSLLLLSPPYQYPRCNRSSGCQAQCRIAWPLFLRQTKGYLSPLCRPPWHM